MTPAQAIAAANCFACLLPSDRQLAELGLLQTLVNGGSSALPNVTPSTSVVATANGTPSNAGANVYRLSLQLQNLGTNTVYYYLGHGCSGSQFSGILAPDGGGPNVGYGGAALFLGSRYNGEVSLWSAAGAHSVVCAVTTTQ
jgi:hypothetical protein